MTGEYLWYVYALQGERRIYVGMTSDLRRRIAEHQQGKTHTTQRIGVFRLIYYEAFLSKKDASQQERYYKTGSGREVLRRKLEHSLQSDL